MDTKGLVRFSLNILSTQFAQQYNDPSQKKEPNKENAFKVNIICHA